MKHLTLIAIAACAPAVPANPSFQQDVAPILAANCVRCHGYPTIGGSPPSFRLDAFADTVVKSGSVATDTACGPSSDPAARTVLCGAVTQAELSAQRIRDDDSPMPPRFPLDEFQIETLEAWALDPVRGAPRADNRAPTIRVDDITGDARVVIRAHVDDADGDLVAGTLHVVTGASRRIVGVVRSGPQQITWDTSGIAPGAYALSATLDDGAQPYDVALGSVEIGADR